jgi:small subunit ribosomal protein S16
MLAIRLQRLGRKAAPVYRVAIQEAQRHPSSGRVVAYVGSYNPHTKAVKLDKEKIEFYLKNGAQPTPRVVRLLLADKIALPDWVEKPRDDFKATTRKPEKLRKNRPAEAVVEKPAEEAAAEPAEAPEEAAAEEPAQAEPKAEAKEDKK